MDGHAAVDIIVFGRPGWTRALLWVEVERLFQRGKMWVDGFVATWTRGARSNIIMMARKRHARTNLA
jgi:hypothetical protein